MPARRSSLLLLLGLLWVGAIAFGLRQLTQEELTPVEDSGKISSVYPRQTNVSLSTKGPTLAVFVHPLCPCTRATLHELRKILDNSKAQVSTYVIFTISKGLPDDWKHGDLWSEAKLLPGVAVMEDPSGLQATLFHATTSGECLLYTREGRLLYHGGITGARGHDGPNRGEAALLSAIENGHADTKSEPAFGCSLL